MARAIIFSDEQKQDIIQKYQDGWAQSKIGNLYGVSRNVIKRILLESNVSIRQRTPKYFGNYDIFETIDSPEKAYWLGFLAADGCNYWREQNASVIINIHQKDIEHLYKFQQFCNTTAEIQTFVQNAGFSNNTPMCKIVLNSKKMSQDLTDKGVVPNKSLILKPPKILEEYYLPFICGYFDGDGSIYKTNQYNNYSLSIQGTAEMLNWINGLLEISTHLEKRNPKDNQNSYYIRCGGTDKVYEILNSLYESCNTHLDRKYEIYKELQTVVFGRNT